MWKRLGPGDRERLEAVLADRNSAQKHAWRAQAIGTRIYISSTGERCRLVVGRAASPGGSVWWSVELLNERGMSPIAGQPAIQMSETREEARVAYRERLAGLRAEGRRPNGPGGGGLRRSAAPAPPPGF